MRVRPEKRATLLADGSITQRCTFGGAAHNTDMKGRWIHLFLFHLDGRIAFEVLLAIAPIVGDRTRCEIYIVANNPGSPRGREKVGKRALSGLVGS